MTQVDAAGQVDWVPVWGQVAARMGSHWAAGRGHLLTEDTLRMCLIEALGDDGVDAARLASEVYAVGLGAGKLDLTMDGPGGTVIELKYPRDSRTGFSPDTMTMGELLRDFCRVAVVDAADRWVTQVINARLARYLAGASARFTLGWAVEQDQLMTLHRATLERLPATAITAIGTASWRLPVEAVCRVRAAITDDLTLYAYQVAAPNADVTPSPLVAGAQPPREIDETTTRPAAVGAPTGARAAILDAITHLTAASGTATVTVAAVVGYLRRRNSRYADSTIRTMMTSHMCVDTQGPGIGTFDDLERLGRGEYRRRPITQSGSAHPGTHG
ncbi:hypothetical protein [Nocardioides sp. BYT-33-1]|uniref:hypothetical protein n=1 Tax=Nocardioides sp. BYT-33-1 TaxID=3416952 RepID=UPI003F538F5C